MGIGVIRVIGVALALASAACSGGIERPDLADAGFGTLADDGDGSTTAPAGTEGGDAVGTTSAGGPGGCQADEDCDAALGLGACDLATGRCLGCVRDDDCPSPLTCSGTGLCAGCTVDDECNDPTSCQDGVCAPRCDADHPCPLDFACCDDRCIDLAGDPDNCNECGRVCESPANAASSCDAGECGKGACNDGWSDCNGDPFDGCENEGACTCLPGQMQECYSQEPETMGVGPCRPGMQLCNAFGTAWGPCEGEITPIDEVCNNTVDDDCDGVPDEDPDTDGDGWTLCGGDCCDEAGPACAQPELVNPGAFEVDGNEVDDDCNGTADDPLAACDAGLASNSGNPQHYAQAIDLCQFTSLAPADPADRVWGVIDADLHLANGAGAPAGSARSIRDGFGTTLSTRFGVNLAVLSTGRAADPADVNPAYVAFQPGAGMGTASGFPPAWYAANGSALPNAPGCAPPMGAIANDPVMLQVQIRVPTNANSFTVEMFFFSAEYPEWVCTEFNDFFVAIIDSTNPANPADGNIAVYDDGLNTWPVGVNILSAADGLFTACTNGAISYCDEAGTYGGCTGATELAGTGFDVQALACGAVDDTGGGTGWLTMSGNVTPGEVMTIQFAIWDTSDNAYDSLVLLDNWQWSVEASEPGVMPS